MMVRKSVLAICALCLTLFLFGCGKPDIFQEYTDADQKLSSLDSLEATVDMNMSMTADGLNMDIPMTMQIKARMDDAGAPVELHMDTSTSFVGQESKVSLYYTNGMAYIDSMGYKYKQAMTADELGTGAIDLPTFTQEMLKEAVRTAKNGEITVSAVFDGNQFKDALLNMLPSDALDMPSTLDQVDLSDVQLTYTINKDGYLSAICMVFTMDIHQATSGIDAAVDIDMDIHYVNLGQDITITTPNLEEYEDSLDGWDSWDDFDDLGDGEYSDEWNDLWDDSLVA